MVFGCASVRLGVGVDVPQGAVVCRVIDRSATSLGNDNHNGAVLV